MRETMDQVWDLLLNDPDFEFVPYYLGLMALVTILFVKGRIRFGDGGGSGGESGGGGGDGGE